MSVGTLTRYGLPFSNVVATGTATNQVTPGRTLETLQLELGGTTFTKAMLTGIKIKANGKPILDSDGPTIDKINQYRGEAANAAFLELPFADYSMLSDFDKQVGAFDTTIGIANITSEITITGATAPTLTPILTESASQKQTNGQYQAWAGVISKLLKYPFAMATGGQLPVTVPFGPKNGAVIKRLHVLHGGNMTGITVKQDGITIHESTTAENQRRQVRHGRVPQLNMYTVDFVLDGNIVKALDTRTANSLEWLLTFSAADSGNIMVEYLDPLGNL